jgi:hypothetical protein
MKWLLALMLLAIASLAQASDKDGRYWAQGKVSCSNYIERNKDVHDVEEVANRAWVAGYITAYNMLAPETYSILGNSNLESALLWLDKYCKANPSYDLVDGMSALVQDFHPTRALERKDSQ